MKAIAASIPDVLILEPNVFEDERGFFMETYRSEEFARAGIAFAFVQDNHSGSWRGVLRGLHYQVERPQGKLVRVAAGEVFDVAVDLRLGAPTFGKWVGTRLSAANRRQVWIPPGFAHGFYTLSEWADVIYKVTAEYSAEWDRTLLWSDPEIAIVWPLVDGRAPLVSAKDGRGKLLRECETLEA